MSALVDWHSHVWLPEHVGDFGLELDSKYTHRPSAAGRPEDHAAAMAEAGIDEYVVIGLVSRHLGIDVPNDFIASFVNQSAGRGIGVAGIDPTSGAAVDEVRRASLDLGLKGIKLAPPYQNFHPHSPEAFEVYEAAASFGMFMIFHQGAVSHRLGVLEVANPILIDRVAREYPEVPIIIAHMGQPWPHEVVPLLRKHPNVFADLSARCTRRYQLRGILQSAIDYGVEDKLVWGSDFPTFGPKEHAAGLLAAADADAQPTELNRVPAAVVRDILYNRPLSLIGIRTP